MNPSFNEIISRALRLDETIFAMVQAADWGIWVALAIVLLAGISEAVGQSIVLFINKVSPRRFWLSLCISAASHVFGYAFWAATIWLIGRYLFQREQLILVVASAVGVGYAPRLLSFFALVPFFGNGFSLLLSLWSLLATVVAIGVGFDMNMGQAVTTSGLGWAVVQIWQRTLGRPVQAIGRWIDNRAAGVPLRLTLKDIPQLRHQPGELLAQWRERFEQSSKLPVNRIKQIGIKPITASPLSSPSLPSSSLSSLSDNSAKGAADV